MLELLIYCLFNDFSFVNFVYLLRINFSQYISYYLISRYFICYYFHYLDLIIIYYIQFIKHIYPSISS